MRAQQAALDQARLAYKATVLTALKDVEDALVALRGDRERLVRLQRAAEAAGNAALLARQRYSSGLVDFQTVLDTQRTQLTTQDSVASARADLERRPCAPVQGAGRRLATRRQRCADRPLPQDAPRTVPAHEHPHHPPPSTAATRRGARSRNRPRHLARRTRRARLVPPPGAVGRRAGCWLLVAAGLWYWQARQTADAAPSYTTQTVARGNLTLTVTANGTLQPTRSINIGSELSGTVLKVNVDVNDRIKKGQVLVELDTAKLRDQILRSRAALAAAKPRSRRPSRR